MDWLKTELLTGFQKLLCLGLERTPAAEILPGTVEAWLEVLTDHREWIEERDVPRIRQAFRTLAKSRRCWPVPADFNEALPAWRQELTALPRTPPNPEKAKAAMEAIGKLLKVAK